MLRAFKYQIYPTTDQRVLLAQHFGCVRHVYNWALSEKKSHYECTGKSLPKRALQDRLVASKKVDKTWLRDVNSQSLLAALGHLDTAYKNFFSGRSQRPTFKSKYSGWQSFQCPQHTTVDFETGRISLPKIKGIKAKLHRSFDGRIKTVTVKRSPTGAYFVSILVDNGAAMPTPSTIEPDLTLGIDLGLTHALIDSDGHKVANPRHLRASLNRLAIEQRKLARKHKGSANRRKQKQRVALIDSKVANRRHDFIHQQTAKLAVKNHATSIAVENLNVKGMLRNRCLAKAIQDVGWGMLVTILSYKLEQQGKNLLVIDRFAPSSKTCHQCGHKASHMPLSVRVWQCPECSTALDRDINAAINIKQFALADALGLSASVKSSPVPISVSAEGMAKEVGNIQLGSEEAPARAASAA